MKRKRNRRRAANVETGSGSTAETPQGEDSSSPTVDPSPSSEEPPDSGGEGARSAGTADDLPPLTCSFPSGAGRRLFLFPHRRALDS